MTDPGGNHSKNSVGGQRARIDSPIALKQVFTVENLTIAWKKTVRNGLRNQALSDLHDYLDYHYRIEAIAYRLRSQIIEGVYRPKPPEVITLEKSNGICRRVVMPDPEDAIILQTLVDFLQPRIQEKQPSDRAFYSRSHDFPDIERLDGTFAYPWWHLWPEFQTRIWKFSEAMEYTVVTDVASYYDTIPLRNLRQQIAKLTGVEGPVLDLLFFVLDAFVWRPDYIPHPGVGLPQINFDTPRLLAHAYLFPADELLASQVESNFVRWMDDIDFAVHSKKQARAILKDLDRLLSSYGVRLNSGKTKILSSEDAAAYFWIIENRYLNIYQEELADEKSAIRQYRRALAGKRRALETNYRQFRQKLASLGEIGHWSKVQKRFLSLLGKTGSSIAEPELEAFLANNADLRESVFKYLDKLGYSQPRFDIVQKFIVQECLDDASLFAAVHLLVTWKIPADCCKIKAILDLASLLGQESLTSSRIKYVAGLWLNSKYGDSIAIDSYLKLTKPVWTQNEWTARQTASVWPRFNEDTKKWVKESLTSRGHFEGLKVIEHLKELTEKFKEKRIRTYLVPQENYRDKHYPLHKILLVLQFMHGVPNEEASALRESVIALVDDPVYKALLLRPN